MRVGQIIKTDTREIYFSAMWIHIQKAVKEKEEGLQ